MTFIYHTLPIKSKTSGFTLIEIIAVLAIISVLAAISLPRFMDVSSNAGNQALSAAVTELNSRESLMWAKIKISPSGWISDEVIFSFLDVTLGSDYKWSASPTIDGGVLQFKDITVDLQRDASTTVSAGNWQLISESDAINKGKKIKIKTRITGIMERRTRVDRRSRKFPPLKYLLFGGRRKVIRRSEDKNNWIYPDQYTFRMFLIIAFIVVLSLIDGFLTLHLADYGAKETNPVMAIFLKHGIYPFLLAKLSLTFFGLICLLILNNFYLKSLRTYVKNLFPIFAGLYSVVIIWQIYIKFY